MPYLGYALPINAITCAFFDLRAQVLVCVSDVAVCIKMLNSCAWQGAGPLAVHVVMLVLLPGAGLECADCARCCAHTLVAVCFIRSCQGGPKVTARGSLRNTGYMCPHVHADGVVVRMQ